MNRVTRKGKRFFAPAITAITAIATAIMLNACTNDDGGETPEVSSSSLPSSSSGGGGMQTECVTSIFNPSSHFCYEGIVYSKCGGMEYDPSKYICTGGVANLAVCNGTSYNPLEYGCCVSAMFNLANQRCQNNVVQIQCGTGSNYHSPETQFCNGNEVLNKCDGEVYDPANQKCQNNVVQTQCGTGSNYHNPATELCCGNNKYTIATQFCNGEEVLNKCGGEVYDPATQGCKGDAVQAKCGTVLYDPATEHCYDGQTSYVSHGGQQYKTVGIGTQMWMAENLNYDVEGSRCYDDDEDNCGIYGRLYDWATAMDLPSSCNTTACASQVSRMHQGICPAGWHIPNYADWNELADFTDGKLKATYGWKPICDQFDGKDYDECVEFYGESSNGTDEFGFAALPGGVYNNKFSAIGEAGYWWGANEMYEGYYADVRIILNIGEGITTGFGLGGGDKSVLISVRCIMD